MLHTARMLRSAALAAALAALAASPAHSAWPHDPTVNVALCLANADQTGSHGVSDGAGGAIFCWSDNRTGTSHIYARRVSAAGVPMWTTDGVLLSTFAGAEFNPAIASDGAGGAIIVYQDSRGSFYDIYAQRVNAAGAIQWAATGQPICQATQNQATPKVCPDGSGGAVITWADVRGGVSTDIYAQRVNAAGTPQWTTDGVAICLATNTQDSPAICPDNTGGAIITWHDQRAAGNDDIYAQRILGTGGVAWTTDGSLVCGATNTQALPQIVSDGGNGAIISWEDLRNGTDFDVYAQKLNGNGTGLWTVNGAPVCAVASNQNSAVLASDGSGSAIIAWSDLRGSTANIFAQHLNASGGPVWTANGIALGAANGNQTFPAISSDASGGVFVAWPDARAGASANDIFAQHVTSAGALLGPAAGFPVCTASMLRTGPSVVFDGSTGAIVAWEDNRLSATYDIFSQRIDQFGYLGNPEPVLAVVNDVPNDQGGKVKLAWYPSYLDGNSDANLAAYDIYTSAPGSAAAAGARNGARMLTNFAERPVPGAYVVDPTGVELYAWQYVATVSPVHFLGAYGYVASTTGDSTGAGNPLSIYMVVGRNSSGSMYWLSAPDSGYSVDNLAPSAPAPFAGAYSGGATHLHWGANQEGDLAGYRLYRGGSPGFVPGVGNLVVSQADTGYTDTGPAGSFYKLSAVDVHGNESPFALLTPAGTTAVGPGSQPALAFALASANPGRGAATFRFVVPTSCRIRLVVFDLLGRQVRELANGAAEAGESISRWDGRDASGRVVASGLYLARFSAQGRDLTTRVVLIH